MTSKLFYTLLVIMSMNAQILISADSPDFRVASSIQKEHDPFKKMKLLQHLIGKKDIVSLKNKIHLLNCNDAIGREGDVVSEILLDEMQREIPIEYDFEGIKKFTDDPEYRSKIIYIYNVYMSGSEKIFYSKTNNIYYKSELDKQKFDKHLAWYLDLVSKRR